MWEDCAACALLTSVLWESSFELRLLHTTNMQLSFILQTGGDGDEKVMGPLMLTAKTGHALQELCSDACAREPYEVVSLTIDERDVDCTSLETHDDWSERSLVRVHFVTTLEEMVLAVGQHGSTPLVFSSERLAAAVREVLDTKEASEVFEIRDSTDPRMNVRGQHLSRISAAAEVVKIATPLVSSLVTVGFVAYHKRNEHHSRTQLLRDAIAGANAGTLQIEVYADRVVIAPSNNNR